MLDYVAYAFLSLTPGTRFGEASERFPDAIGKTLDHGQQLESRFGIRPHDFGLSMQFDDKDRLAKVTFRRRYPQREQAMAVFIDLNERLSAQLTAPKRKDYGTDFRDETKIRMWKTPGRHLQMSQLKTTSDLRLILLVGRFSIEQRDQAERDRRSGLEDLFADD